MKSFTGIFEARNYLIWFNALDYLIIFPAFTFTSQHNDFILLLTLQLYSVHDINVCGV